MDLKLEVVVLPVSDVDRAKAFYESAGFRVDIDKAASEEWRAVHLTPPGSECSIMFGTGLTSAEPGSAQGLYLVVSDIEKARTELVGRGIVHNGQGQERLAGLHPDRTSYASFATFSDPDGNGWVIQEVMQRLPGR